ncbi:MAG: hypothetical protein ABIZ72_07915 [Candidatus Limnocylindrales bacterium]
MADPSTPILPEGREGRTAPERRRPSRRAIAIGAVVVIALGGGLLAWQVTRSAPALVATGPEPGIRPLIAIVDPTGALATVDPAGRKTVLSAEVDATFGFPAWSPDGRRIAGVRDAISDSAISIFPVRRDDPDASPGAGPTVVYRSATVRPFYLYWTPDGRRVSFLATEGGDISLRVVPDDGSAPLDGSAPGGLIRRGAPLYFDWIAADRLLLHVGLGPDAFTGEVGLDGSAAAPGLTAEGEFRPAVVGADGRYQAFVRGQGPASQLVVAARDGSGEHSVAVFGATAAVFDPRGATLGAIGPDQPGAIAMAFPIGPLRLIEAASGTVRTLIDGTVVGFFWSPDGKTIAALRLQAGGSQVARAGVGSLAAGSPVPPTLPPDPDLHLVFVSVADGAVRSDRVIKLASHFVNQFLPYFDQYALSHRVWSPDSSSILLPITDQTGTDQLAVLPAAGGEASLTIPGQSGFWSP